MVAFDAMKNRRCSNAIYSGPIGSGPNGAAYRSRGLVLPVVLVVLLLLALLSASYAFHVQADHSAGMAMSQRLQCRLAAEAGVQAVKHLLRSERDNPQAWYSNPARFDQALVWSPHATQETLGKGELNEESEDRIAYRFSVVADNPLDDETLVRYGVTDESAKLNINFASEEQLLKLIAPLITDGSEPLELVHAILDWRDSDDEAREFGAESLYYGSLPTPHRAKNAPFETVEELLMVKGMTGRLLYGEDYDRNGLLTPNEDDGETSFPMDNADGFLERGLLPYITVYTHDFNVSNDNKPRIYMFTDAGRIRPRLEEVFNDQRVVDFLIGATRERGTSKTYTLALYLEDRTIDNVLQSSPLRGEAIAKLFDSCTLNQAPEQFGLININTAPARVLACIKDLPPEVIPMIIQKRDTVTGPIKSTIGWLLTEQILDTHAFSKIENQITARGRQFSIESIGFADHVGVFSRLQEVVDMRGPLAQVVYHRDLTRLGLAYPVRGREGERRLVIAEK
jgi:type II secretory pathway component PulK